MSVVIGNLTFKPLSLFISQQVKSSDVPIARREASFLQVISPSLLEIRLTILCDSLGLAEIEKERGKYIKITDRFNNTYKMLLSNFRVVERVASLFIVELSGNGFELRRLGREEIELRDLCELIKL